MYLRELRIHGFKSFCDPTTLELGPGVTAIVGPNGCGKSNIADAIRWVLGEQSSKSLRAGTMQDVIFQGTDRRRPVNLCEVILRFADCEAQLGTAFNEIEVSRHLVRDGGNTYRLNGKACRLRDIQRLFLDTGVGQVSYSFMLQGQIDQILSTNPAERRIIFEEAAGISKYKAQRREALNKLAQVEQNLARVTDVMEEVSRQIGSLRRQASKAIRYQRIHTRYTALDLAAKSMRFGSLTGETDTARKRLAGLRQRESAIGGSLAADEQTLAASREARSELNQRLQEAQQAVYNLRSEKENALNQAENAGTRAEDLRRRHEAIAREIADLDTRREELARQESEHRRNRQSEESAFGTGDERLKASAADLTEIEQRLADNEQALRATREKQLVAEGTVARTRSETTTLEVDLKSYEARHAALSDALHQLREEAALAEDEAARIADAQASREAEHSAAESAVSESEAGLKEARDAFRRQQTALQEADREIAQHIGRIALLRDQQRKLEGFGAAAKSILQGKLDSAPEGSARILVQHLRIEEPYTEAFESLLGESSDIIAVGDSRQAHAIFAELAERKLGRVTLSLPLGATGGEPADPEHPDWLTPLNRLVSAEDEALEAHLGPLLEGCYACDRIEPFIDFLREQPHFPFREVVSVGGDRVSRRGLVHAGQPGKRREGFASRRAEITRLEKKQAAAEERLDALRRESESAQEQIDQSEEALEQARARRLELTRELSTLHEQTRATAKLRDDLDKRIAAESERLAAMEADHQGSLDRLEKARTALTEAGQAVEDLKSRAGQQEQERENLRQLRDERREGLSEVRLALAERRRKLELIDQGLTEIGRRREELDTLERRRRTEMDELLENAARLDEEQRTSRARADEIEKTLRVTRENLEARRTEMQAVEKQIAAIEESLGDRRKALRELEQESSECEVSLARLESRLEALVAETRREHDIALHDVSWKEQIWHAGDAVSSRVRLDEDDLSPDDPDALGDRPEPTAEDLAGIDEPNWEEVAEEVAGLRSRLQSMGPVNLVAIEEYRDLRERHEFLKNQSDDLWKSQEQLVAAIDDINRTSQEIFANTFEQVRKNFVHTFTTLFGGGEADLKLVDKEDVLESGIDIVARPPGTRLRTLQLLSGGQKTMTAVALLFAIYMVKPSPFCVLDELDAPLDDANIGRFTDMLKSFLEYSQFVIITHNKRTIATSDAIFGVTMEEKGVSKMVSMRWEAGAGKTVAAEA